MSLHFTEKEFESRENTVIKSMKEKNLDALLLFRQESMYWLTGYDTFGYVFFQCLVLTSLGDKILLTRVPDLRQAQNTSNIKDIRIWVDQDNNNPAEELKSILVELNLENKNLVIGDTSGLIHIDSLCILALIKIILIFNLEASYICLGHISCLVIIYASGFNNLKNFFDAPIRLSKG